MENRARNIRKRKQMRPTSESIYQGSSTSNTGQNSSHRDIEHVNESQEYQRQLQSQNPTYNRAVQLQRHYAKIMRQERRDILSSERVANGRNRPHRNIKQAPIHQENNRPLRNARRTKAKEKYSTEVSYYGPAQYKCKHCRAVFWGRERIKKGTSNTYPICGLCCKNEKISLPQRRIPPEPLRSLLDLERSELSAKFLENIRVYSSMFLMTSSGARVDNSINGQGSPYIYRISGENYHRIGSLLPEEGKQPSFLQLYVYDTVNELSNRVRAVNQKEHNKDINNAIIVAFMQMLDTHNVLVKVFRTARDRYHQHGGKNFYHRLVRERKHQRRKYIPHTSSEIAMLVMSDFADTNCERDVVVESINGYLKRISDLHPTFMALQYPHLFPYGEDGFHTEIPYAKNTGDRRTKRQFLTALEFYSYTFQYHRTGGRTLEQAGRLYQQYIEYAYSQIEQQRLRWIRQNQGTLRTDLYQNICDAFERGDSDARNVGMRTILPSSFTGGPRYMTQNYQDAMAISREYGNPDFFITFTANPKWQEITDMLGEMRGQKAENRPDIETRVFKMKLDEMIHDIMENEIFGKVDASIN